MKITAKVAVVIFVGLLINTLTLLFVFITFSGVFSPKFSEAILQLNGSLTTILIICLPVVILLTSAISVAAYYLVIKPLNHMNQVAKIIASGNLSKRLDIDRGDEIGELSLSLNKIINNLTSGMQNFANALRDEKSKERELATTIKILDEQKAKDDAMLSSIGEGVIALDKNQNIILFNQAAVNLTRYSYTEAIGKYYSDILKFKDEKNPDQEIDVIVQQNKLLAENIHLVITNKHQEVVPVSPTISPITDRNGEVNGMVIALRDITRERQLDKMKDEFVSVASHELRTPMTAIKGFISMIFDGDYGPINEALKDPLNDIASSVNRLINLVNDVLDVSRIEAGRVKIALADITINEVITDIVKLFTPMASEKRIQLIFPNSEDYTVNADTNLTKEILSNLIQNALKFTDKGEIRVITKSENGFLRIMVSDTGAGIPEADQKNLFSKFYQVSSTSAGRPVGTGLGLYISKEFARKMGGDLWLEKSVVNQGTTFILALPLSTTAQNTSTSLPS